MLSHRDDAVQCHDKTTTRSVIPGNESNHNKLPNQFSQINNKSRGEDDEGIRYINLFITKVCWICDSNKNRYLKRYFSMSTWHMSAVEGINDKKDTTSKWRKWANWMLPPTTKRNKTMLKQCSILINNFEFLTQIHYDKVNLWMRFQRSKFFSNSSG